jgi:putative ABC transport system ATP-binding protein
MLNGSPILNPQFNAENSDADLPGLSQALVFLARQLDRPCEEAQACRLLSEVMRSNPGTVHDSWWSWLLSAGRSLGLTLRVSDVPPRDLPAILRSGARVVTERRAAQDHRLNFQELDAKRIVLVGSLPTILPERLEQQGAGTLIRVIIAASEADLGSAHHRHEKPWVMLWKLLAPDRKDLWAVLAISGVAGLLMLSVPVTAQQLVRTVTFATLYQPIVVLSLMLLGLLGFVAALQALQVYVAEIIQRRLFVRIAGQVTRHLTQADAAAWRKYAMPELVNRFLEVAIVQKVTAALIVDGIAILLTTLIGMSVMAFYHPFLLGYDVLLLVLLATIFFGFGRNGVKTAIQESRTKYGVLSWLEDMARCPGVFRTGGVELLAMQRTDVLCADYLHARRSHFSILMRQIVLVLILQVIATTTLLGLGGFLVLNEQLTLGQLVAAELIVAMIVASFAKLGKHLEGWYDLLASVDKLSHLLDLPAEPHDGLIGLSSQGPAEIVIRKAAPHQTDSQDDTSSRNELLRVAPGETAALLNWNSSLTQDLADGLRGLRGLSDLELILDGVQIDDVRGDVLRHHVTVARDLEFLPGTIAENVHLSRPRVSESDVREACDAVGITEELRQAGRTLTTQLLPNGWPLNAMQQRRLILARALAGKPRVLFMDHLCDVFAEVEFRELWQRLSRYQPRTTILVATARQDIALLIGHVAAGPLHDHRQELRTH